MSDHIIVLFRILQWIPISFRVKTNTLLCVRTNMSTEFCVASPHSCALVGWAHQSLPRLTWHCCFSCLGCSPSGYLLSRLFLRCHLISEVCPLTPLALPIPLTPNPVNITWHCTFIYLSSVFFCDVSSVRAGASFCSLCALSSCKSAWYAVSPH